MNTRRLTALMAGVACLVGAFAAGCTPPADETASPEAGASPGAMSASPGAMGSPGAMSASPGAMASPGTTAPPGPGK